MFNWNCWLTLFALASIFVGESNGQSLRKQPNEIKYPVTAKIRRHNMMEDARVFELLISIDAGFAIYANPVSNVDLDFAKTTVRVVSKGRQLAASVDYPEGREVRAGPEYFKVYKNEAKVLITVKEALLTEPIEFIVRVQPTDLRGLHFLRAKKIMLPFKKT